MKISSPLIRSKLFVPGSRPELFEKAMSSAADAVSFDLEDAVPADRKQEARAAVAAFLRSRRNDGRGKIAIVRVNHIGSGFFLDDVGAILGAGLDLINIPKVESEDEIRVAVHVLASAESERGLREVGLLANIETPRGLRCAARIATAHPRVVGLQLGYADLFEPFGIDPSAAAMDSVRLAVRLAAAEAGMSAYDGAFAVIDRPDLYRSESETARRMGFAGKSCIHPSQIPIANEVFSPRREEIDWAREAIAASERGGGVFVLDGRMVDEPFLRRARNILSAASRLGLLEREQRVSKSAE